MSPLFVGVLILRVAQHANLSGFDPTLINRGMTVGRPAALPLVKYPVAIMATLLCFKAIGYGGVAASPDFSPIEDASSL